MQPRSRRALIDKALSLDLSSEAWADPQCTHALSAAIIITLILSLPFGFGPNGRGVVLDALVFQLSEHHDCPHHLVSLENIHDGGQ